MEHKPRKEAGGICRVAFEFPQSPLEEAPELGGNGGGGVSLPRAPRLAAPTLCKRESSTRR